MQATNRNVFEVSRPACSELHSTIACWLAIAQQSAYSHAMRTGWLIPGKDSQQVAAAVEAMMLQLLSGGSGGIGSCSDDGGFHTSSRRATTAGDAIRPAELRTWEAAAHR